MSDYIYQLDSVFWITLATLLIGGGATCLRFLFKSKCRKVSCCCFSLERDIEAEIEEQKLELQVPSRVGSVDNNV